MLKLGFVKHWFEVAPWCRPYQTQYAQNQHLSEQTPTDTVAGSILTGVANQMLIT